MHDEYVRAATVVRVIDGDTVSLDVDLGFYVRVRMSCRLVGLNTPESSEPGGSEVRAALTDVLSRGAVTVVSVKADKYAGRFDADVVVTTPAGDVLHVNRWLIEQGFAVAWDGRGPRPLVPWPPTNKGN
jgi:endonuclease YncB( thermonuclease family)